MERISLSRFRAETKHKHIKFIWRKTDGTKVKEFESNKFYCNPYGEGENRILSLPKFSMAFENEFYKDGNKYIAKSEYGTTEFEIVEDAVILVN